MKPARSRSRQEREKLVGDLAESGLSVAKFAERRGVHRRTLMWWRWKLRTGRSAEPIPRTTRFLPVVVEGWRDEQPPTRGRVEAMLSSGVTLRFEYALDAAGLRELVAAFGSVA